MTYEPLLKSVTGSTLYVAETFPEGAKSQDCLLTGLSAARASRLSLMWGLGRATPCYHTFYVILSTEVQRLTAVLKIQIMLDITDPSSTVIF